MKDQLESASKQPTAGEVLDLDEILAAILPFEAEEINTAVVVEENDADAPQVDLDAAPPPAEGETAPEGRGTGFLPLNTRGLRLRSVGPEIYRFKKDGYVVGRREAGSLAWMIFPTFEQALSWHERCDEETDD